ncbi:MAG: pyridoxal-phosphate dependent enzyme [Deltaproteobacteria bacterium]|jgi:D-cysteine desulfhydrase|nr:pyridoxal-phosphate dependent enzyme [Deltaproteobacteria bacterium]MBW2534122.1 pyridoxal-phosphate dependent enzyme [Deltaproteobacteria bacterium]
MAHRRLAQLPSPVVSAEPLARHLGVGQLYLKQDGLVGEPYGGGKVRKLEFLLAEAQRQGQGAVVTFGGVGSNHALATALYGRRLGLKVVLYLVPEPVTPEVGYKLRAAHALGAELHLRQGIAAARRAVARLERGEPGSSAVGVIEPGGTSPLGNLGFVNAAFELAEQIRAGELPVPDRIYLAAGTLGSAVGLSVGLQLAGLRSRVMAVQVAPNATAARFEQLFRATVELLRNADPAIPALDPSSASVSIVTGQLGRGYAQPTPSSRQAARIALEVQHLELDGTYTAKALAALIHDAPTLSEEVLLFWNSYDSRRIPLDETEPADLPVELRGYLGP